MLSWPAAGRVTRPAAGTGWLKRYTAMVTSGSQGGVGGVSQGSSL